MPDSLLSWNSGVNAYLHTIYIGTNYDDVNEASVNNISGIKYFVQQDDNYYAPKSLDYNTTYYWRVDEQDNYKVTRGRIWTFKTRDITYQAYKPNPVSGATDMGYLQTLSWSPSLNSVKHDVYLGTDYIDVNNATIENPMNTLVSIGQEPNYYQPDILKFSQLYYWRVDEIDCNGITTKGDVWEFTVQVGLTKERGCFIGQTPVWLDCKVIEISEAAINQKTSFGNSIEQIEVHEGVWDLYNILLESDNCITVADNHIFMTESGKWMSLRGLMPGMKLKTAKSSIEIKKIKKESHQFNGKVYNLKIEGSNRYMVGKDAVIVQDY